MNKYAKAIVAALVAGLGTLLTALADNGVTPTEWVTVAMSVVAAGGAVFGYPNAPSPFTPSSVPSPGNPPIT